MKKEKNSNCRASALFNYIPVAKTSVHLKSCGRRFFLGHGQPHRPPASLSWRGCAALSWGPSRPIPPLVLLQQCSNALLSSRFCTKCGLSPYTLPLADFIGQSIRIPNCSRPKRNVRGTHVTASPHDFLGCPTPLSESRTSCFSTVNEQFHHNHCCCAFVYLRREFLLSGESSCLCPPE